MEKRRSKRMTIRLLAELFSVNNSYVGAIENLSEYGMNTRIFSPKNTIDFIPGAPFELEFRCLSGEKLNLHCETKWAYIYKDPTHDLIIIIGMEIIDPPQKYNELIRNLFIDTVRE